MLTLLQLFENKVDHTTYFGNNLEYIQGYDPVFSEKKCVIAYK